MIYRKLSAMRVLPAHKDHEHGHDQVEKQRGSRESAARGPALVTVAQLPEFDETIDVRSEGEFAEDHIPGAINCPVLDDAERVRVGTLYKQRSAFEAKKIGAALVSANIARHLQERFLDRPREWRPLVYCWRGGNRSDAFAHVLYQVGWRAARMDGGYRAYRRAVVEQLAELPGRFRWRVICGLTGTGKSRLLRAVHDAGGQALDLEALAAHRGSVLGNLPDAPQPTQKLFESRVWRALTGYDASRPVYVEAESRKIGALRVPERLIEAMWKSPCVVLESPVEARIRLLKSEYSHFFDQVGDLTSKLDCLAPLHGRAVIEHWKSLALAGSWDELTGDLLLRHYDPAYTRAIAKHYPALDRAPRLVLKDPSDAAFRALAQHLLESARERAQA
ncbi:MAG TPA: tRNA 2-selenouridine(34) synthase MnmH [Burkholderiales bacterium]|nr:tRNA 2-selenouridine(34) synthase MnmH [Burkholderiales bacterium]